MVITTPGFLDVDRRSNRVRLRTLVVLRWIAIIGQLSAITVALRVFDLQLDLGLSFLAIGASVIANIIFIFVYPENKRLQETEVTLMLIFDVLQLSALLFLTGGLHNPFALLILAPVTIAATALSTRSVIMVGAAAIAMITLVMWFHMPLRTAAGIDLKMPPDLVFGFWAAILTGVLFLGAYARRVTAEIDSMSQALLAAQMALVREQKIADLAGVVAATAHELGTPLATIKLAATELMEELTSPELQGDARLIGEQADRCRDILRSMGRAGKQDLLLQQAPLGAVVREAAEPHINRGKSVEFSLAAADGGADQQPTVVRRPEIIHGLRNLVQNAVDFAAATVWVDIIWSDQRVTVRIIDDGRGFSQHIIGRIGDPFINLRHAPGDMPRRPNYQGMGMGLFIAKTLLERSGGELSFANASDHYSGPPQPGRRCGAIVEVVWPIDAIRPAPEQRGAGLGENLQFST
ncbi:MAG: sensor histidine kinase RegB [Paracoccaceae bacterium]